MLFAEERHEPRLEKPWDESAARAAIAEICEDVERSCEDGVWWPVHPLDREAPSDTAPYFDLYLGAGGVLWGLDWLQRRGLATAQRDYRPALGSIAERAAARLGDWFPGHPPAYVIGDLGTRLVQWKLDPSAAHADELWQWLSSAARVASNEIFWGAPGVVLALTFLLEASGEARWCDLLAAEVDAVLAHWKPSAHAPVDLWEQDILGQHCTYLGAVHGAIGNVHALLRATELLGDPRRAQIASRGVAVASALARVEGDEANWHSMIPPLPVTPKRPEFLLHYCHGAPGFAICLDAVARGEHPELESLLVRAGNLVWRAGPLRKGANLCHGTAGNGYVFLKLWQRTGDPVWLERARAFAMHALDQVRAARLQHGRGRYTLWTGDVGTAVYVASCIQGDARFPTLDAF